jgi:hypothetical protein
MQNWYREKNVADWTKISLLKWKYRVTAVRIILCWRESVRGGVSCHLYASSMAQGVGWVAMNVTPSKSCWAYSSMALLVTELPREPARADGQRMKKSTLDLALIVLALYFIGPLTISCWRCSGHFLLLNLAPSAIYHTPCSRRSQ